MEELILSNITTDSLKLSWLKENNITADVLRIDKIHPLVSGNKWFKLRYYIEEAKKKSKSTLVTYGGAWSNHILATAAACRIHNLKAIGIIRGEQPASLSETLTQAAHLGMQLIFLNRDDYKMKKIPEAINASEDCYIINEGGFGIHGANGAADILEYCTHNNYTHIGCAAGTGTMTAGLLNHPSTAAIISISVLKNNFELSEKIKTLTTSSKSPFIMHDYHFGGYAKYTPALITFMNDFYKQTGIPSDFVYTGKLFFTMHDLVKQKYFPGGSRLLIIHSGGLQGNRSLKKGTLIF
jgi:1-aminocyclopropane-1-carboxylate deaminase